MKTIYDNIRLKLSNFSKKYESILDELCLIGFCFSVITGSFVFDCCLSNSESPFLYFVVALDLVFLLLSLM